MEECNCGAAPALLLRRALFVNNWAHPWWRLCTLEPAIRTGAWRLRISLLAVVICRLCSRCVALCTSSLQLLDHHLGNGGSHAASHWHRTGCIVQAHR